MEDDTAEYNDRFLAGYDKGRLLGRGACAVVWLAQPSGQKGYVAIKQVATGKTGKKRSDAESARKEIFFGSYFFHPGGEPKLSPTRCPGINHIAKLLDYSETKRDIWMVMEFGGTSLTKMAYEIKGEFLRGERLYRVVHLPMLQAMKRDPEVLKDMLRQLLSALCVLADNHIVHSDIKPDNILIEEDENHQLRCRFIDLGSAFTFDSPESLALATPEYMPPEALETCIARSGGAPRVSLGSRASVMGMASGGASRKPVDPSAKLHRNSQPWSFDIWSLGSILLELCLGTPLWLSYKCRVADDQRANSAATGLFAVPGRDPEKIISKQLDALRNKGLANVLRNAQGVPINNIDEGSGLELLSFMLAWDPLERISPHEALEHPWLLDGDEHE
jgi:serine/threonine protein kinase